MPSLRELIRQHALTFAPPGQPFVLKHGTSPYYVDLHKALLRGDILHAAAQALDSLIPYKIKLLGAVPTGGLVLLGAVLERATHCQGFFLRPPKDHGTQQDYEGYLTPNVPAAILDDTATSGKSLVADALQARREGVNIHHAFVVFDREEGATQALASIGVTLYSCARKSQFPELANL